MDILLTIKNELFVIFLSMLPIVELRGAIPAGAALGLEWYQVYPMAVVGNLIPVPFIFMLLRKVIRFLKEKSPLAATAIRFEQKMIKKSEKILKYSLFGLALFVAIPLPGTGAWTGAAIAVLLNRRFKTSFISIAIGVIIAGFIVTGVSYGFLNALAFLV